jgi:hypothetical protein
MGCLRRTLNANTGEVSVCRKHPSQSRKAIAERAADQDLTAALKESLARTKRPDKASKQGDTHGHDQD